LLVESDGAKCVFVDGFTNKEGEPLPLIVQKTDGGYNYATTDLAAVRYRIQKDNAKRLIYVTDSGQANHFAQVFAVSEKSQLDSGRCRNCARSLRLGIGRRRQKSQKLVLGIQYDCEICSMKQLSAPPKI
jgi:Arginyl-tRNA synthetase